MRSSAKYRPTETSYISADDHFAALQIDLCVRGWKTFGGFAAQSNQFPNYSIFQMNQLRAFNACISIRKTEFIISYLTRTTKD